MALASVVALAGGESSNPDGREAPKIRGTLEILLSKFAHMPGLAANLREERYLSLLQEPLVSSGTLYYAAPGQLARHIVTPTDSWFVVTGDRIRFRDADGHHELALDASPVLQTFIEAFRLFLAGDLAGLKERFEVEFQYDPDEGGPESWQLVLLPRRDTLKRVIRSLVIAGRDGTVSEVSILEKQGDRTIMTFSSVDPDRRFSDEELTLFFRTDP